MLLRKILRLSLNIKICISKNMALFLKVLTLTPCFSKCKFLRSETVLEFYARHVHCTKSDFLWISINFAPLIFTSHTHIKLKSILSCKKFNYIMEKYFILIEYQRIGKKENLMKIVLTCKIVYSFAPWLMQLYPHIFCSCPRSPTYFATFVASIL